MKEVAAMATRHWQVFAALAARDSDLHMRVLDAVPGSVLMPFEGGGAEVSMIIDAGTYEEATLFVRLALLELGMETTGLSITEVDDEELPPLVFTDPAMIRAEQWARNLTHPVPAMA